MARGGRSMDPSGDSGLVDDTPGDSWSNISRGDTTGDSFGCV